MARSSSKAAMIPRGKHDDWIWPFSLIPRRWNTFASDVEPVKICGTEDPADHLDIPERGRWAVAGIGHLKIPAYFAATTRGGWHVRIGLLRYDYVNHYYTGPTLTIKKLK